MFYHQNNHKADFYTSKCVYVCVCVYFEGLSIVVVKRFHLKNDSVVFGDLAGAACVNIEEVVNLRRPTCRNIFKYFVIFQVLFFSIHFRSLSMHNPCSMGHHN